MFKQSLKKKNTYMHCVSFRVAFDFFPQDVHNIYRYDWDNSHYQSLFVRKFYSKLGLVLIKHVVTP